MIDLHIHSNFSDGTDSVEEILQKAEEGKLHYISITDHDNCDVYDYIKKVKVKNFYSGTIIKGIELKCAYKGKVIDVLGYDYSLRKMKKLIKKYYPKHGELQEKYLQHFYEACVQLGLELNPIESLEWDRNKDWATIIIYNEIKSHPENESKCPEKIWESLDSFRYNYLYNPETSFYIDKTEDYPNLEKCIEIIHKAKGKAFIAHLFIYEWAHNKHEFIKDIIENYNIDGIECYYTKFSKEEMNYISDVCDENNLLKSGGSDYHGLKKPGIEIGKGNNNLRIPDYIIGGWCNNSNLYGRMFKRKRLLLTAGSARLEC